MTLTAIFLIALALSADNFALSMAIAAAASPQRWSAAIRLPAVFGICSFAAPLAGWLAGAQVTGLLRGYGGVVAFAILAFVGWRILRSGSSPRIEKPFDASTWRGIWGLGLATSADALAVGFGLAMTAADIVLAAAVIGALTAGLSFLGFLIGGPLARGIGDRSKTIAALTLFAIGVRALAGHAG